MGLVRAKVSAATRRFIIGRSGGCCAKCRMQVFCQNEFGERARLGDDAHIWAYSSEGPRGRDADAPADRNASSNLLLLCKNCHTEVDKQPIKFPPAVLCIMREEHHAWVDACLGQEAVQKPRFHYALYLNVPRLDMYAVGCSLPAPAAELGDAQSFRDLGMRAGRIMAQYTQTPNVEELYGFSIKENSSIADVQVGRYCYLGPITFRTVAIDRGLDPLRAWAAGKSLIYRRFGNWRLDCLIDPRWITTVTAECTLSSGQAQLCAAVRINEVDASARRVRASPLFLAQ